MSRTSVPEAPPQQVKAWLFRIARNVALDHHRQRTVRPEEQDIPQQGRPASQYTGMVVNEALASLADLDRDVFLMREVAGLNYDEIAHACELTSEAVRSRLHRVRLQLRDRLTAPIQTRRAEPMRQHPVRPRYD